MGVIHKVDHRVCGYTASLAKWSCEAQPHPYMPPLLKPLKILYKKLPFKILIHSTLSIQWPQVSNCRQPKRTAMEKTARAAVRVSHFNYNKLQAVACITSSVAVSIGLIYWVAKMLF